MENKYDWIHYTCHVDGYSFSFQSKQIISKSYLGIKLNVLFCLPFSMSGLNQKKYAYHKERSQHNT